MSGDDEAVLALRALARNLAELRVARGMSQTDLAGLSGLSQQRISEIETGRENVTVRTVEVLARALQVAVGRLFR